LENVEITSLALDDTGMQLTITPKADGFERVHQNATRFVVTLHGGGEHPIRDRDALRLDGDGDQAEGGDYEFYFVVQYCLI
jgi:hypothetical protein